MAKKMRNGLTQKQRKTRVKRVAEAIDIYEIRPNRPMRENWKNYPDPAGEPVVNTETRQDERRWPNEAQLGVVEAQTLSGGKGPTSSVCKYCLETNGHAGWCPVISVGGAS